MRLYAAAGGVESPTPSIMFEFALEVAKSANIDDAA
jgi:hypothetical protein